MASEQKAAQKFTLEIKVKLKDMAAFRPVAEVDLSDLLKLDDYEEPYQLRFVLTGQAVQSCEIEFP